MEKPDITRYYKHSKNYGKIKIGKCDPDIISSLKTRENRIHKGQMLDTTDKVRHCKDKEDKKKVYLPEKETDIENSNLKIKTLDKLKASLPAVVLINVKKTSECEEIPEVKVTVKGISLKTHVNRWKEGMWKVTFRPCCSGQCDVNVIYGANKVTKSLEIVSNSPIDEFSYFKESPTDICCTKSNYVYVSYIHTVVKFTFSGIFLRESVVDFDLCINYLAVSDKDGRVVISGTVWGEDSEYHSTREIRIKVYSRLGVLLNVLPTCEDKLYSSLSVPIAMSPEEQICVLYNKSINYFDNQGKFLQEADLEHPVGFCSKFSVDLENKLWIADSLSGNVTVFNSDGKLVKKFYACQSISNDLGLISGISVDKKGYVLVSERFGNKVVVYTTDGEMVSIIGSEEKPLKWPSAIAASDNDYLYVADHGNLTVKKYRYR